MVHLEFSLKIQVILPIKIAAIFKIYGGNLLNIGDITNSPLNGSAWNGWMMSLNVDNKIVTVENTLKVEGTLEVTGIINFF